MSVSFLSGVSINNGVRLVQPPALITISSQPTDNTVNYGANATFGVTAAITRGAVLTYQWQFNRYGQGSWSDISGAKTSTYTVNSVTTSANTDAYRVVLTGTLSANSVTSNTARLYVTPAVITINTQPSSNTVNEGQTSTFSVSASATLSATLSYQWQKNDGSYWTNVSGATSNTYTTGSLTNAADNGDVYRVYITADKGATPVTSSNASLTVNTTVVQDSIDVVNYSSFYGAADGTQNYFVSGTSFGTVTSSLIKAVAYYSGSDVGAKTIIELKDGSYPGYDVLNGAIGMDSYGSRRTFTVGASRSSGGGTNYTFQYDGTVYFKNGADPLGLQSRVGTNLTIWYDAAQQSTYSTGVEPEYVFYSGNEYYGANKDPNATYVSGSYLPIFGFLNLDADYIKRIYYAGTSIQSTIITMNPGYYIYGSSAQTLTVQSNGAIESDTNGSSRYFKLNGTNQTLTFNSSTGNYTASGDVFSLSSLYGQSLTLTYDTSNQPSQGGGGGGGSSGSYTAGTDYSDGTSGPPGVRLGNVMNQPSFMITPSFWTNTTGRDAMIALTSGATVTAVVNGTTYTVTLTANMAQNYSIYYAPATFSPSLSFPDPWTAYIPTSVSAGGGVATYVANTDYDPGGPPNYGPPGLSVGGQVGGPYNITVFTSGGWTNTAGRDAILAKTSGTTFTAIIGGTTLHGTITSGWTSFGPGSYASVTLDGTPMGQTTSITI
jgi:hypothetical protein